MKALNSIFALFILTTFLSCASRTTYKNACNLRSQPDMRTVKLRVVNGEVFDSTNAMLNAFIRGRNETDSGDRTDSLHFALLLLVNRETFDTAGFYTNKSGKIIRSLVPGSYDIFAYHHGYSAVIIENIQFKKSEIIELCVLLEPTKGSLKINGRNFNDSLIAGFYNSTLINYFTFYADRDEMKFGSIIIRTNADTSLLLKQVGNNRFKFSDSQSSIKSQLTKPIWKNKARNIYSIDHTYLSNDTIDVNVGHWIVEKASNRYLNLGAICGGTMGYIPDGRFIYNSTNNTWEFLSKQDVLRQKVKALSE